MLDYARRCSAAPMLAKSFIVIYKAARLPWRSGATRHDAGELRLTGAIRSLGRRLVLRHGVRHLTRVRFGTKRTCARWELHELYANRYGLPAKERESVKMLTAST